MDTLKTGQYFPEEEERNYDTNDFQKSLDLLFEQQFHDGFLTVAVNKQQKELDEYIASQDKKLTILLGKSGDIDAETALQLGVSVEEGRRLGKVWGTKRQAVMADEEAMRRLMDARRGEIYTEDVIAAMNDLEESVVVAATEASEQLGALLNEINERKSDADFVNAMDTWANSPSLLRGEGDDGRGFNAGIVHYFEYRADPAKSGRFHPNQPLSVDGFVDYSQYLASELHGVLEGDPQNDQCGSVLRDSVGNERVVVATKYGANILAYRRADDEKTRITTCIPGQGLEGYKKRVEESLGGKGRGVINKLVGPVELVGSC